jgi:hypothetical protein
VYFVLLVVYLIRENLVLPRIAGSSMGQSKIPLCGGQFSMGLPAEEVSGVSVQVSGKKTKY